MSLKKFVGLVLSVSLIIGTLSTVGCTAEKIINYWRKRLDNKHVFQYNVS